MIIRYTIFLCAGESISESDITTKSMETITICSTSTKDKIKLHIIIFCVKHNRDRTITLEFEMGVGDVT